MSSRIPFVKATACGNDFLLIDERYSPADGAEFARQICNRRLGVGADGVEWLGSSTGADVTCRLYNADGSEAEISGNGTRCVAAWYVGEHQVSQVRVKTGAGVRVCSLVGKADPEFEFETDMGKAEVEKELPLRLSCGEVRGVPVSIGNPQYIVFVDEFPARWQDQAAEIQCNAYFKHGVNVEFVECRTTTQINIRIFERGAGETQSSGTGSCASAAAAVATGRCTFPVEVRAPGGTQSVRSDDGNLFLRGPARLICKGEFLA